MIPGDQHHGRVGQGVPQPLELAEGEDDGRVGGTDGMEEIAGHDHGVGPRLDHAVHGEPEGLRGVRFPLIDAGRGLPVILADAEVRIGDVRDFHP